MFKRSLRHLLLSLGLLASVNAMAAGGYTRYDFSFVADNGVSASGWFNLNDSWTSSTSVQPVTSGDFSASLNVAGNPGISSGSFSSLSVYNIPVVNTSYPYGILFTVNGISYEALANKFVGPGGSSYAYSLKYSYSSTTVESQIQSANQSFTSTYVPVEVPELDGKMAGQFLLFAMAGALIFRSRKYLHLTSSGTVHTA